MNKTDIENLLDKILEEQDIIALNNLFNQIEKSDNPNDTLCEYLELGQWFYDQLEKTDFDSLSFITEYVEQANKENDQLLREREYDICQARY